MNWIKGKFLQDPSKIRFWLLLGLVFKFILFVFQIWKHEYTSIPGFLGYTGGDTPSYLDPIENWLQKGSYTPDYRMPGYGFFYLVFRVFSSKVAAAHLLVFFQVVVAGLSVYPLAMLANRIFKSREVFYLVFFGYGISSFSNLYDASLLTESLSVSFLILTCYWLMTFFERSKTAYLVLVGFGLAELVFLRPIFAPLFVFFGASLLIKHPQKIVVNGLLLLLPFIVLDAFWVKSNYAKYHRVIPLTKSKYYEGFETSIWGGISDLVQSWGGSSVYWDHSADIRWIGITDTPVYDRDKVDKEVAFPFSVLTKNFNNDSLLLLRSEVIKCVHDSTIDSLTKRHLEASIKSKVARFKASYIAENPFGYYVKGPLLLTKKFLLHSGTFKLFTGRVNETDLNKIEKLTKYFYSVLFLATLAFGFLGILFAWLDQSPSYELLLPASAIPLYGIFIHAMVLRVIEWRYLVPFYPFLTVFAAFSVVKLYRTFFERKKVG